MASSMENPRKTFEQTWQGPSGLAGFLSEVNNQPLGKRFMVTAFVFFFFGGVLALLMRIQLAVPGNHFLGPEVYNQFFTMHGSTMMYLFAVPFLEGLAIYLLPLMLGSRDVAYPRLTAFGYWAYLFGGILLYTSFLVGAVPDVGWFGYTPLSGTKFSGTGTDLWLLGLTLVELAGITAAVEIIVTILKFRAPGMSLDRMPLFIWAMLVVGVMILFAFTTLLTATVLLEMDRTLGTCFFEVERGGNSLLWQHLFWFFGHPEVYIMFLPATGVVSMVIIAFAQRRIVGYSLIAVAMLVTGFLSFGLWVHHMFTTGLPELSMTFFTAASLMIAIATGIQIFAWIATLWGSQPALKAPLLFVLGFIFIFVLGGLTGVMVAIVPFDWQVHDTYFIVAHFHYVMIGGVVFPIMAGLHYWLPKITGRLLLEGLERWSFWLTFLGFNITFFPMHIMGLLGMPRRVYTYPESLELGGYNFLATIGAFLSATGFLLFFINFWRSCRHGEPAGDNPWNGDSLEWSLSSPPPSFSFYRPPVVHGRHALWDQQPPSASDPMEQLSQLLAGQPETWRGTLVTDELDSHPQAIQWLPGPSYSPLLATLGILVSVVGILIHAYLWTAAGTIFTAGVVAAWLWPKRELIVLLRTSPLKERTGLPILTTGTRSTVWWSMLGTVTILGVVFAVLFYAYFYLWLHSETWPQGDLPLPPIAWPLTAFLLLAFAAAAQAATQPLLRAGKKRFVQAALGMALSLAMVSLGIQAYVLNQQEFNYQTNAYGSIYFVTSGMMVLVLLVGLALNLAAIVRIHQEDSLQEVDIALQIQITKLYWNFLAGAGLLVFAVLYLSPHLLN